MSELSGLACGKLMRLCFGRVMERIWVPVWNDSCTNLENLVPKIFGVELSPCLATGYKTLLSKLALTSFGKCSNFLEGPR
jgi:hypothetical protein